MSSTPIEVARTIAERAHAGQLDKLEVPYIEHPAMVVYYVQRLPDFAAVDQKTGEAVICAAWLHDVVEDTGETPESLAAAGVSPAVVAAVMALTRTKAVVGDDYYRRIREMPVALLVKTADIAHNLQPDRVTRLKADTREKLKLKYDHALEALDVDPMVITALHEQWAVDNALPRQTESGSS